MKIRGREEERKRGKREREGGEISEARKKERAPSQSGKLGRVGPDRPQDI